MIAERLSRLCVSVVVTTWIARYLGPSEYGKVAYALALFSIFQVISNSGADNLAIAKMSASKMQAEKYFFASLLIKGGLSIASTALALLYVFLDNGLDSDGRTICIVVLSALLLVPFDSIDAWFTAQASFQRLARAKILAYLLGAIAKIILIETGASSIAIACAIAADAVILSIALICILLSEKGRPTRSSFEIEAFTELIREGRGFFFGAVAVILYIRLDQILIAKVLDNTALGVYAAIVPLSLSWSFLPAAMVSSSLPRLIAAHSRGSAQFEADLQKDMKVMFWTGFALAITVALFSKPIIFVLLGGKYSEYSWVLSIHAMTIVFQFLGSSQTAWTIVNKRGDLLVKRALTGAMVCLLMNTILLPCLGIYGACVTAVFSQALSAFLLNRFLAPQIFRMQVNAIFSSPFQVIRKYD